MRRAILEGLLPEFSTFNIPPAMMHPNMNMNRMNMNNMGGNVNRNMGMNNMGMNMNRNLGPAMNNMNPWGPNTRGMGGYGGPVARGGQLVVAGSVVGQWGANWGRGGFNHQQRGGHHH